MVERENSAIAVVRKLKSAGQLKNYIGSIHFPFYRNLELGTEINFDFPLTVFIGQNGCGKSSALHALYGTVRGKTPGDFWFDTKVDPIEYYNDEKKRHSFWYTYIDDDGKSREVVKARIRRAGNPNYWETSRPLTWAGMQKDSLEAGKRNEPIAKNVVYLDFRGELSAFDKFYYFGDLKKLKSKNKQEFIRLRSSLLKKIFDKEVAFVRSKAGNLNHRLEILTGEEVAIISNILGRKYSSCESVEHSIFRNEGYSVLFQTNFAKYSEAFAGSGEMAVVRLVREVLAAPNYSLILLDEPEVSLHPGAQSRVRDFLLEQIKLKKHQIVLTSHSPILVTGLPKEAIKVFSQNPNNGRFAVTENLTSEEAFYHIEFPLDSKKTIIVEDKLVREVLLAVLQLTGSATENLFDVKYFSGGQTVIKKNLIPVYCRDHNPKEFIIFDGDQNMGTLHFDWREFQAVDLNVGFLQAKIKELTNADIKFPVDSFGSGGNDEQQLELLKQYLDYYRQNVYYLPKRTPEEILWSGSRAINLINAVIPKPEHRSLAINEVNAAVSIKEKFRRLTKVIFKTDSAENIFSTHRLFIQGWTEEANADMQEIRRILFLIKER